MSTTTPIKFELTGDDAVRFWEKVDLSAPNGCWEWTAALNADGYGLFRLEGKTQRAHRVSFEALGEAIPEGLFLDHLCRNRACINPDHLEPVTPRENQLRSPVSPSGIHAAATHCKRGHEFTDENTSIRAGFRECMACARMRGRTMATCPDCGTEVLRANLQAHRRRVSGKCAQLKSLGKATVQQWAVEDAKVQA